MRAAHGAHHVGRAVLLVVGVQDEQYVERPLQYGVGLVFQLGGLPHHVQEIAGIREIVVRVGIGHADCVAGGKRRQGRHLRDQAQDLQPPALLVEDVLCVGVEGR